MRRLVIDTSGVACSIAIIEDGTLLAERHETLGRGHAERLIPWIAALPDGGRAGEIVVGCGPGSFTGVRIGIAAARGLGFGWGVPVRGIPSFHLIAACRTEAAITVAVEAGHGELFVQDFSGAPLEANAPLRSLTPDDAAILHRNSVVLGSGATRLVEARGFGSAIYADARAADLRLIQQHMVLTGPMAIYGRGADAKPMAA
jgi:tRNA threonylcarbamoyladenosine biosynthesis protein TsaB